MPTTVVLGRDQSLTLDGVVLEGTREFEIDIDMKTADVTAWHHKWTETLPLVGDVTIKLLIYWKDNYSNFDDKLNKHPAERMKLEVSNAGTFYCVPTQVGIKGPINGVMAWDVTLKLYSYE